MSKKRYIGNGKWCWTEGCKVHSTDSLSLKPRSEKDSAVLREQSIKTLTALPSKVQLVESGNLDKVRERDQAMLHLDDARLHLAMSPRNRQTMLEKLNNASSEEAAKLRPLYDDSDQLHKAYRRANSRFFLGSGYTDEKGTTVQAIPLSLNNITEVNEWIDNFYTADPVWNDAASDDADSPVVDEAGDDVVLDKKTKAKIFRKKNKLWYRDHDGNDVELKSSSYLIRERGKEGFILKDASDFEDRYESVVEKAAEPIVLSQPHRERFFPSTKLSDYISIEG